MDINISSKLLENIIGKIDRFGLAKLIKTGQVLRGRVLAVKGETLIVDFGKGPVAAKTNVPLKKGDFIKVVIKDVKGDTLILKLLDKKEGIMEKDIEGEIIKNFPKMNKEEAKIAKSFIKHNIPINKKNIDTLREVVNREEELKELLEKLPNIKEEGERKAAREKTKAILKGLSEGYLIERKEESEFIFIFPYINEKMDLVFQRIRLKYKKNKEKKLDEEEHKYIEFSLNMSKIGPIKIAMDFDKKRVDAKISTTKKDINKYIEENIDLLKEGLEKIGLILREIDFGILDINQDKSGYKKIIKGIDIKI